MASALDRSTEVVEYTRHNSSLTLNIGTWYNVPTQGLLDGLAEYGLLTKLSISACTFRDLAQLQAITMALPALNDLEVRGRSTWQLVPETPPHPGPAPSLQYLALDLFPRVCMFEITDWIVATPAPAVLQTLDMTMDTLDNTPTEILTAAKGLKALHLFYAKRGGFEEDDDDIGASIGGWLDESTALEKFEFTCVGVLNANQLHSFFNDFADLPALTQLSVRVHLWNGDDLDWEVIGGILEHGTLAHFELTVIGGTEWNSEGIWLEEEPFRAEIEAEVRKWSFARTSVTIVLMEEQLNKAHNFFEVIQTFTMRGGPTTPFEGVHERKRPFPRLRRHRKAREEYRAEKAARRAAAA